MKPIIKVENLSKQYQIKAFEARPQSLRERLHGIAGNPLGWIQSGIRPAMETVWALKDVSFTVEPGEVVGLIGRNGAGKSTLLKLLSRVTEPTAGRIDLYGPIGSLLEVGTGFHPELTGRENVLLNGAMLGMKRAEIMRKFDEIVDFSEIEKYIDTRVKWYSSGMYLRLAFSVAVHLEPEILILDEVLSVGDSAFQLKCYNKMEKIRKEGRTLFFVSHNMQAITRMCERAIYLSEGVILGDGPAHQVASQYLGARLSISPEQTWENPYEAPGNEITRLRAVRVRTAAGEVTDTVDIRKEVGIEMEFEVLQAGHVLVPNYHVYNEEGLCVFIVSETDPSWRLRPRDTGHYVSTAWIPGNLLAEGTLIVGAAVSTMSPATIHFFVQEAVVFHVIDSLEGDSARGDYTGTIPGVVRPLLSWTSEFTPDTQMASTPAFEESAS